MEDTNTVTDGDVSWWWDMPYGSNPIGAGGNSYPWDNAVNQATTGNVYATPIGSSPFDISGLPIDPEGLYGHQGGGANTDPFGIFSGGLNPLDPSNGLVLPLPVDPITAIAGSILLSGGIPNPFGGGGNKGILDRVENIISDPIGTTGDTITNVGNQIENPSTILDNPNGGSSIPIIPIPSGGNNPTNTVPPSDQPTGSNTTIIPTGNPTQTPVTPTDAGTPPPVVITPGAVGGNPTQTTNQTDSGTSSNIVTPTGLGGSTPSDSKTPPSTGIIPTGGGGSPTTGTVIPPIILPTSSMPDTSIASPLDRNYYNEGLTASNALNSLTPNITNVYGNASNSYGMADYRNFGDILKQYGITNAGLTGLANQQTFDSNSALRSSNLRDVGNMAGQAYGIQRQYNPGLYGSLDRYQQGANDLLSKTSANLNAQNYLTPQEIDQAQQTARAAWSARGLVNSPGAVGAEILGVDSAWRQRQQEAFANQGNALQSYGQQAAMQSANQFNPFSTILGAQYGQQTQNVGTNQNLYQNVGGFSSGQMGNQFVEQAFNPFNNYANDVFGSNFNAANARSISSANNAASMAAGKAVSNSNYADMFMNALYGIGTQKGWFKP